jgi:hypothetical protein
MLGSLTCFASLFLAAVNGLGMPAPVQSDTTDCQIHDPGYAVVTLAGGKDRVTIAPNGGLETLASNGITIDVWVKGCGEYPFIGLPAEEVVVYNGALCLCNGGNHADADTDQDGHTTFTGAIRGGGCAESLDIYADGIFVATVQVKTNSPDAAQTSGACHIDMSDVTELSTVLGNPGAYTICFDWNESGTIDAGEVAYLAAVLGAECQ